MSTDPDMAARVYPMAGGEDRRIHALMSRNGDYVSMPAAGQTPVARAAAPRGGKPTMQDNDWTCAPLEIDAATREVRCNGRLLDLTGREAHIVVELYKARGTPLSQALLWERCWMGRGWSHFPEEFANTVDQAIKRLRKSLKRQCQDIPDEYHPLVVNIWAQGFALRNLAALSATR
ncbi:winged helix-turn-helix domain-containing protein [Sphingomonas turrisvirgatae]|uniref:OmpR/PhoB-type domain-containing protein n=1 Tax=Sphingomonas turrisvirgatae TaxID=1888892 RepID=A0A1E3LVJ4_9SPHN|nr:winged helix-turn-helix domain-containing protein [Sphingomonas turrisvirgatae]ODP37778.1 hypothetical protein BFL28_02080 [Sphingomonas turrisvirgatae]